MSLERELQGKVAIVTGASAGIGKATALRFARAGASVVVASRGVVEGEQTAHEICERGGDAIFVKTDVSQASEVEAMVNKTIDVYGRLDCACNNAGVIVIDLLTKITEEDWDLTMKVNLKGIWLSLKYEIPQILKQGGGAIVNIASAGSIVSKPGLSIYSASKGGVVALTKGAALEYASSGIRINAISSASVKTNMLELVPEEQLAQIVSEHPIGRIGRPEEIAEAVFWLCSDKSSFMTGHNMVIDGGYTAQ
ncbi:MAG: SDR family oxidoreductase [Spirulina sp.]